MPTLTAVAPLTGSALLAQVKKLGRVSKTALVRGCGYTTLKKNGKERLNFTAFYEALLEAKGVTIGREEVKGRQLEYVARVQFNGNLMVGRAYTSQLKLDPGTEFEIVLGRKQIRLIPLTSGDVQS